MRLLLGTPWAATPHLRRHPLLPITCDRAGPFALGRRARPSPQPSGVRHPGDETSRLMQTRSLSLTGPWPLLAHPREEKYKAAAALATVGGMRLGYPQGSAPVPTVLVPAWEHPAWLRGAQQPGSLVEPPRPWGSPGAALAGSSTLGHRQHSRPPALTRGSLVGGDDDIPGVCGLQAWGMPWRHPG